MGQIHGVRRFLHPFIHYSTNWPKMNIVREDYDRKPLMIKQGALHLWGTPLLKRVDLCRVRHLYSFSGFFAEMCFDKETEQLTCICSFTNEQRLEPYLEQIDLAEL